MNLLSAVMGKGLSKVRRQIASRPIFRNRRLAASHPGRRVVRICERPVEVLQNANVFWPVRERSRAIRQPAMAGGNSGSRTGWLTNTLASGGDGRSGSPLPGITQVCPKPSGWYFQACEYGVSLVFKGGWLMCEAGRNGSAHAAWAALEPIAGRAVSDTERASAQAAPLEFIDNLRKR
jgi:hypothetical protein